MPTENEDSHQPVVDPLAKVEAQQMLAERDAERFVQHLSVGGGPRRVGPDQREDGKQ